MQAGSPRPAAFTGDSSDGIAYNARTFFPSCCMAMTTGTPGDDLFEYEREGHDFVAGSGGTDIADVGGPTFNRILPQARP